MKHTEIDCLSNPTVFISFNCQSVDFVDSLAEKASKTANIIRYEDGVASWGSFTEFMNKIRNEDFAVLVISDAYLKSFACMYEVCQLMQENNWQDKTMFAIMADAVGLYGNERRIAYIKHWADECDKYEKSLEGLPQDAIHQELDVLKQMKTVRDKIGEFLRIVSDRKNPPIYTVIEEICKRINLSVHTRLKIELSDKRTVALGHWYVMEFLKQYGSVPASTIIEATGLSATSVYRILRQFQKDGLVIAEDVQMNNRKTNIYSAINDESVGA